MRLVTGGDPKEGDLTYPSPGVAFAARYLLSAAIRQDLALLGVV